MNAQSRQFENTLYDAKRVIGRKFDDEVIQRDLNTWQFKMVEDAKNRPMFEIQTKDKTQRLYPEFI